MGVSSSNLWFWYKKKMMKYQMINRIWIIFFVVDVFGGPKTHHAIICLSRPTIRNCWISSQNQHTNIMTYRWGRYNKCGDATLYHGTGYPVRWYRGVYHGTGTPVPWYRVTLNYAKIIKPFCELIYDDRITLYIRPKVKKNFLSQFLVADSVRNCVLMIQVGGSGPWPPTCKSLM